MSHQTRWPFSVSKSKSPAKTQLNNLTQKQIVSYKTSSHHKVRLAAISSGGTCGDLDDKDDNQYLK